MLTNSTEYKALKNRIAKYLNIDSNNIFSIENPMKNKKLPYILVKMKIGIRFNSILLRDSRHGFSVVN